MSETLGRLLAAGQKAEVFEWGSRAVKLYRCAAAKQTVFREAAIHATVEVLGLPVPAIWGVQKISGRWGVVFDRVSGVTFAEQMRRDAAGIHQYLQILARLHTRIHAHTASQFSSLKGLLATDITRAMPLDDPRKQILLDRLNDMPDGDRLCHGDFHPMNVLGEASQPIVIDWPNACHGDPAGDVCRSYLILKLHADEVAEPYLDAYCRVAGVPRSAILDWLVYVAAARLAEEVPGESNTSYSNSYGRCEGLSSTGDQIESARRQFDLPAAFTRDRRHHFLGRKSASVPRSPGRRPPSSNKPSKQKSS